MILTPVSHFGWVDILYMFQWLKFNFPTKTTLYSTTGAKFCFEFQAPTQVLMPEVTSSGFPVRLSTLAVTTCSSTYWNPCSWPLLHMFLYHSREVLAPTGDFPKAKNSFSNAFLQPGFTILRSRTVFHRARPFESNPANWIQGSRRTQQEDSTSGVCYFVQRHQWFPLPILFKSNDLSSVRIFDTRTWLTLCMPISSSYRRRHAITQTYCEDLSSNKWTLEAGVLFAIPLDGPQNDFVARTSGETFRFYCHISIAYHAGEKPG